MSKSQPNSERVSNAWNEPVLLQIGKGGLSEGTITEAKRLVKKHKYLKVKLLRSTGADKHSKHGIFEDLCKKCGAGLAGVRGNTAIIFKRK
ncbi:MAG: YhbY family RNA-binding protein [Candidatus Thorarchaeota archaeon]|nr:YhbY family RNA-binding protein [Candidatus Thorarchaeota archaeon]MCK5240385.1 YhbY family RNA-binding protein [Candidatus Thorarchaeota archaeon]